jgi:hypothetical protein
VIILHANVLIGFLDVTDPRHDASLDLLERHFVDGFGRNVLTVAEALVHPTRVGRQDAAAASLATIGVQVVTELHFAGLSDCREHRHSSRYQRAIDCRQLRHSSTLAFAQGGE